MLKEHRENKIELNLPQMLYDKFSYDQISMFHHKSRMANSSRMAVFHWDDCEMSTPAVAQLTLAQKKEEHHTLMMISYGITDDDMMMNFQSIV